METNFSHEKHVFEFDRVSTTFRLNGISILFDQFILRDRNLINNYNEKIHLDVWEKRQNQKYLLDKQVIRNRISPDKRLICLKLTPSIGFGGEELNAWRARMTLESQIASD